MVKKAKNVSDEYMVCPECEFPGTVRFNKTKQCFVCDSEICQGKCVSYSTPVDIVTLSPAK